MRLYVIVRSTLDAGQKAAQACHGINLFREAYRVVYDYWYSEHNNIVILQDEELEALSKRLEEQGLRHTLFHEPDYDDQLTAICAEPAAWKQLSNLPLAC